MRVLAGHMQTNTFSQQPFTSCLCQLLRQTALLDSLSASPSVLADRHLHCFPLKTQGVCEPWLVAITPKICCLSGKTKVPAVLSSSLRRPSASALSVYLPLSPPTVHGTTMNLLPILSHTGHMSLERIYYTISSFTKSCKEAREGGEENSEEALKKTLLWGLEVC